MRPRWARAAARRPRRPPCRPRHRDATTTTSTTTTTTTCRRRRRRRRRQRGCSPSSSPPRGSAGRRLRRRRRSSASGPHAAPAVGSPVAAAAAAAASAAAPGREGPSSTKPRPRTYRRGKQPLPTAVISPSASSSSHVCHRPIASPLRTLSAPCMRGKRTTPRSSLGSVWRRCASLRWAMSKASSSRACSAGSEPSAAPARTPRATAPPHTVSSAVGPSSTAVLCELSRSSDERLMTTLNARTHRWRSASDSASRSSERVGPTTEKARFLRSAFMRFLPSKHVVAAPGTTIKSAPSSCCSLPAPCSFVDQ